MAQRPPPPLRPGLATPERIRRMREHYKHTEKPFDPAEPQPRHTSPHHFSLNAKRTPMPVSGYAYHAEGGVHDRNFRSVSDEVWDQALITPERGQDWHFLGTRTIDGAKCNVWRVTEPMTGDKEYYAQTVQMSPNGGSSRELSEMQQLLRDHGYDPSNAKLLQDEGIGTYELEVRLKEKGGLERTHGATRMSPNGIFGWLFGESSPPRNAPPPPRDALTESMIRSGHWSADTDPNWRDKVRAENIKARAARKAKPRRARRRHSRNPTPNHGNVTKIWATPYNHSSTGARLASSDDWRKLLASSHAEEFHFDFVSGPDYLNDLWHELNLDQGQEHIELWFDELEHMSEEQAAALILMGALGSKFDLEDWEDAVDEAYVMPGTILDQANELVAEADMKTLIGLAKTYFDWKEYGEYITRSIETGGTKAELEEWQDFVERHSVRKFEGTPGGGDIGDAAWEWAKEQYGETKQGGPTDDFYASIDESLRDFIDTDSLAVTMGTEGWHDFTVGGKPYCGTIS